MEYLDTIQNALKRLFCSIGGNADKIRNKDDVNAILDEMTDLQLGERLNNMEDEIENANEPFIVTLTPTSEDLSGIMDKTPQELFEAWTAGKTIIADVPDLGSSFVFTTATFADLDDDGEKDAAYLAANFWYNMGGQDLYMVILTQIDGYSVYPFALTPANAG